MSINTLTLLIVLTSHQQLGDTGEKTGLWLEEFTTPYYALTDAGIDLTLASPHGGAVPIDPRSEMPESQTSSTQRLYQDKHAQRALQNTLKLSDVKADDFDGIFYPGGHGPMWDLVDNPDSIKLIEDFWRQGKPVSAVCHGPAVLVNAKNRNGEYIINNRQVTGFSNTEEAVVGLTEVVPFLLQDMLIARQAQYSKAENFQSHVVVDGMLITGQNPSSAQEVADKLINLLTR